MAPVRLSASSRLMMREREEKREKDRKAYHLLAAASLNLFLAGKGREEKGGKGGDPSSCSPEPLSRPFFRKKGDKPKQHPARARSGESTRICRSGAACFITPRGGGEGDKKKGEGREGEQLIAASPPEPRGTSDRPRKRGEKRDWKENMPPSLASLQTPLPEGKRGKGRRKRRKEKLARPSDPGLFRKGKKKEEKGRRKKREDVVDRGSSFLPAAFLPRGGKRGKKKGKEKKRGRGPPRHPPPSGAVPRYPPFL